MTPTKPEQREEYELDRGPGPTRVDGALDMLMMVTAAVVVTGCLLGAAAS